MTRRAVFIAALVANKLEEKRWRRDLEIWSAGLVGVGFDSISACVTPRVADASSKPTAVDQLLDATHANICTAVRDAASACTSEEDQLWLVISNHGDSVQDRGCSTESSGKFFSVSDFDREMGSSPARQVVVAGQCGAGHFARPPAGGVKRACLAACQPKEAAYNAECTTVGDWLFLVATRLFCQPLPEPMSSDEKRWFEKAQTLGSNPTLEAVYSFAALEIRSRTVEVSDGSNTYHVRQKTQSYWSDPSCSLWKLDDD